MSDNEIVKLEGFPPLKRLSTLLAHNNRVARIAPGLGGARARLPALPKPPRGPAGRPARAADAPPRTAAALPKLETLGLANNRLQNLGVRTAAHCACMRPCALRMRAGLLPRRR